MRAGGENASHLESARLRLVDKEYDQCNRGCQRGARAVATTAAAAADSATAARGLVQAGAHQAGHDVEQALLAIWFVRGTVVLTLSDALRRHSSRRLGRRSCG